MTAKFSVQFATSRMYRKTSVCLDNFGQEKQEPLKDYLDRFTAETMKIRDLNPAVALNAMQAELRSGPFLDSLAKRQQ